MTNHDAVEAFVKYVFKGDTPRIRLEAELCVADLAAAGFTITPTRPAVSDEKLREALHHVKDAYGDKYWLPYEETDGAAAFSTIEAALTELDQLRAAQQWQPIETFDAPAGKPVIFLDYEGVIDIGWFNRGEYKNRDGYIISPTHWMPLPAPPAQEGDK